MGRAYGMLRLDGHKLCNHVKIVVMYRCVYCILYIIHMIERVQLGMDDATDGMLRQGSLMTTVQMSKELCT